MLNAYSYDLKSYKSRALIISIYFFLSFLQLVQCDYAERKKQSEKKQQNFYRLLFW